MKKKISLMVVLCLIMSMISMFPVSASAETSGTCGDNVTWKLEYGVLTISGTGEMYDYPDTIELRRANTPWLANRQLMGKIVVEEGVTKIGNGAFQWTNAKEVEIANTVEKIGKRAFSDCPRLKSVTVPGSVKEIGDYAFEDCPSLETLELSDGLKKMGSAVIRNAFIKNLEIPDSVAVIGSLEGSYWLESVKLPNRITTLGYEFFEGCKSLKSVEIPDSVKMIGNLAFTGCESLTNIKIPDSVTKICDGAFQDCTGLKKITIPDSVIDMGDYLFFGCTSLAEVKLPDNMKAIPRRMFSGCSALADINMPNGLEEIWDGAFEGCKSLKKVIIPNGVKTISGSFVDCSGLEEVIIPDGVETLGGFSGCSALEEIIIPDSVKKIYGFRGCSALKRIDIPDGIVWIHEGTFADCENLTSVIIPDSVTAINRTAFSGAYSITDVYYKGSEEKWNKISVGEDNFCLTEANIHFNSVEPVWNEEKPVAKNDVITITINGDLVECTTAPYIKNGRTLVPLRAIFEALGAEVSWDNATRTAIGEKGNVEVKITIGENVLYKNGKAIKLDAVAEITNNKTMVPVRAISEAFGCKVEWNNDLRRVEIAY